MIGLVLIAAAVLVLAGYAVGRLHGKRLWYHQGQVDAAIDYRMGYQRACADVVKVAEEPDPVGSRVDVLAGGRIAELTTEATR